MHYLTHATNGMSPHLIQFMVREWLKNFTKKAETPLLPVVIVNVRELCESHSLFDMKSQNTSFLLYLLSKNELINENLMLSWIRLLENHPEENDFALVKDALCTLDELGELQVANARDGEALAKACMELYGEEIVSKHIDYSLGKYSDSDDVPGSTFYMALQYATDHFFDSYESIMLEQITVRCRLSFLDLMIENEQSHGLFTVRLDSYAEALKDLAYDSEMYLDRDMTFDKVYGIEEFDSEFSAHHFHPLRGGGFSCITRSKQTSSQPPTPSLN